MTLDRQWLFTVTFLIVLLAFVSGVLIGQSLAAATGPESPALAECGAGWHGALGIIQERTVELQACNAELEEATNIVEACTQHLIDCQGALESR